MKQEKQNKPKAQTFRTRISTGESFNLDPETLRLRVICHRFLDRIPDIGIPEICESMGRIYQFYLSKHSGFPILEALGRHIHVRIVDKSLSSSEHLTLEEDE